MHFDSVQTLQKRMQVFPDDFTSFARIFAPSICPSLAAFLISAFTLSPSRSTFKTCPGRHHRSKQIHGISYMDAHVFIMTRMIPGEALLVCKSMGPIFSNNLTCWSSRRTSFFIVNRHCLTCTTKISVNSSVKSRDCPIDPVCTCSFGSGFLLPNQLLISMELEDLLPKL